MIDSSCPKGTSNVYAADPRQPEAMLLPNQGCQARSRDSVRHELAGPTARPLTDLTDYLSTRVRIHAWLHGCMAAMDTTQ